MSAYHTGLVIGWISGGLIALAVRAVLADLRR